MLYSFICVDNVHVLSERMLVNPFFSLMTCLLVQLTKTIRLEYKISNGQILTYSEVQIIEQHDVNKHLDQTIQYIQMNYTEYITEMDSIKHIERKIDSIRIIPTNQHKSKQLSEATHRKFGDQSMSRPAELSTVDGNIILPPPNDPSFPEHELEINQTWIIPIMNSLGEIHYKLIRIDENNLAEIEFEGGLAVSPDTILTGKWTFDIQRGVTLTQQTISTSSIFADRRITKTIIQKLLSIE